MYTVVVNSTLFSYVSVLFALCFFKIFLEGSPWSLYVCHICSVYYHCLPSYNASLPSPKNYLFFLPGFSCLVLYKWCRLLLGEDGHGNQAVEAVAVLTTEVAAVLTVEAVAVLTTEVAAVLTAELFASLISKVAAVLTV